MNKPSLQQLYISCLDFIEKHQYEVDRWTPRVLVGIILLIVVWSVHTAKKPITVVQQQELVRLSEHYLYPHSKSIAQKLLEQSTPVQRYQYFHLLRVMHDESKRLNVEEEMKWEKKQQDE